ncbi:hypothetical protein GGQ74_002739 [Desulfobaculum xiamenense]|uniref:Uncharacterized protein n=1 Tax=Desulfobaculum xiamenense TaxID=995050 RepID=A0A846QU70_9BACT|nr:hypothetical protein [Desulfobaculum xiamenense]NJB69045.1 hypothetical protein [Desulfobaculum xiamenense]
MKREFEAREPRSYASLGARMREELRPGLIGEIGATGICDAMIGEYGELASAAGSLLDLLGRKGFEASLSDDEREAFSMIMARISMSGYRAGLIVEESSNAEMESHLVQCEPQSRHMN